MQRGRAFRGLLVLMLGAGVLAVAGGPGAGAAPEGHAWGSNRVCAQASPGVASCNALVRTDHGGAYRPSSPAGYGPAQLRTAYNLSGTATGHPVVAIVDAYGDSHAYSDLSGYRSQFGLPAIARCTNIASQTCFDQMTQTGTTTGLPHDNSGWDEEQSLDVDMVSAACSQCSILLVDANSASFSDLATAENEAVALGANVVSNSYGGSETTSYASAYSHPGVAIVVSSGDNGYQNAPSSPASYPSVVAAGGTSLTSVSPRVESAWKAAGSYCSASYAEPTWQQGVVSGCTSRAVSDVSSDADPNTGVTVYDQGWWVFGGTSVSSPFIGAVIAAAGNWSSFGTSGASYIYSHRSSLNDITSGSNGSCKSALCAAGTGWDGPTGLGSPNSTGGL